MPRYQSAEEVEQAHLQAFEPSVGPLYHALCNEVTWLHAKWLEYQKLYAQSEKRIDFLNETAGFFFRVVQDVLWEDVLLHIARLTDPPKQRQFENLTILRLPEAVKDPELASKVSPLVEAAKASSKFARQWRNKRLAHRDLVRALDTKAKPLPGVSRQHVEEALSTFRAVLNALHAQYLEGEVAFEHFRAHGDADALVHYLRFAVRAKELQQERLRQGRSLPEDFEALPEA